MFFKLADMTDANVPTNRRDLPHPTLSLCSWDGKLKFGVDYEIR
jgi:hypothetical protein